MPNIFFMSDLHLGHKSIVNWSRTRFVDVKEHDEYICDKIRQTVGKNDKLFIVGDLTFSGQEGLKLIKNLPSNKYLVLGNHDGLSSYTYLEGFKRLYGMFYLDEFIISHMSVHEANFDRRRIFNIHGHFHNGKIEKKFIRNIPLIPDSWKRDYRYFNVAMEHLIDYTPIEFEEIRSFCREKLR